MSAVYWILWALELFADDSDSEVEEIDLDIGPGQYRKDIIPVRNEDGNIEYYIRSVYTYLTIEEGEAEKRADGALQ